MNNTYNSVINSQLISQSRAQSPLQTSFFVYNSLGFVGIEIEKITSFKWQQLPSTIKCIKIVDVQFDSPLRMYDIYSAGKSNLIGLLYLSS